MEVKKKRLTLDLDASVQERLKVAAALKGMSMSQYCLTAIENELAIDGPTACLTNAPAPLTRSGSRPSRRRYLATGCCLEARLT